MSRDVQDLDPAALARWPLPDASGGKEQRGRVVVVGGSRHTPGAVLLAAEAAVRAGAGKPQVATVGSVAVAASVALPEAFVTALPETDEGEIAPEAAEHVLELAADCDAVLLGPGLLSPERACAFLEQVLPHLRCPVVVDALGMAYVTAHPDGLAHLEGRAVLTPNESELAETLGRDADEVHHRLVESCVELVERTGATVVTGGEQTVVAAPDSRTAWSLAGGVPGLGVAGSGDVKAGVLVGLLGRGLPPEGAAAWAVALHQAAGRAVSDEVAPLGFLAREVLAAVPREMARLAAATGS
ncbi:NAD(P)H-hydrate dehydratase [Pedococcus sp. 2YAF34]|uniref:NAD(P)H-hydrate dehydratase n=1 Tax=Pedococcus sp. 2YAF34 TaxID=3233032 RepID=UPI003F995F73